MAETLMLLNPSTRPSKRGKRKTASRTRRKTTYRTRRAPARTVVVHARANPATRTRKKRRSVTRSARAVAHTIRRKYKRNPSSRSGVNLKSMLMPAVQGAAGSMIVNTLLNYVPLPENFKSGILMHGTRVLTAVGLGYAAQRFVGKETAKHMAQGAMTVAIHDLAVFVLGGALPGLKLGQYISGYDDVNVGEYVSGLYASDALLNPPNAQYGFADGGMGMYSGNTTSMLPEYMS